MHHLLLWATLAAAPADFAGTWEVHLTANYSTCKDRRAGDALSETWEITAAGGKLAAKVTSSAAGAKEYKGEIKDDNNLSFDSGPEVGVELHGSNSNLSGRRVVASRVGLSGSCAVIFDLGMQKQTK